MVHPFDRYAAFTDLPALLASSEKPLRKCVRVNTLKCTMEQFHAWAGEQQWQLTPVPWCAEGFFIDREDRSKALGRDLLHLLGAVYMQEAASMLPPELLDVHPGQTVLDMSAAPGSKSTQMAAKMGNTGVLVCNDMQEKRLWTLKTALHRSGVINYIMTKKVGQWFAKHMTERFDRVLCDAPCTAQGTSRKDSDALDYCSPENVGKMAKLQRELLEAAIHATKVGGRIVYSTCTLTPEENEEVILSMLEKFPGQLEAVDPRTELREARGELREFLDVAINDSGRVQQHLSRNSQPAARSPQPMLRVWPHVHDVEGFFAAVLQKTAPTKNAEPMDWVRRQEDELPLLRQKDVAEHMTEMFGIPMVSENERLYLRTDQLLLSTLDVAKFGLPVTDYALGIPFAKRLDAERIRLSHETATLRGVDATLSTLEISKEELRALLDGKDIPCDSELKGDIVLLHKGFAVGTSLAKEGKLWNRLPRWVVQRS
jgi:16S rRNA (cytosine1407-C5)-methyltransferase